MKNIRFFSFAAAAIAAALSFTSCQKENAPEMDPATKLVTVTDASGKNTATVRLTSADAAKLESTDWAAVLSVETVFQAPDVSAFQEPSQAIEAPAADGSEVQMDIVSQQLEPGAIGISLHFNADPNTTADRWQWVTTYTTSYDNIKVRTNYNCHDVYYYKRPYSYSGFSLMAAFFNRCTPNSWTSASSIPSYQMQAKIYYNSNTSFTITAW